jgi:hypothetical protein
MATVFGETLEEVFPGCSSKIQELIGDIDNLSKIGESDVHQKLSPAVIDSQIWEYLKCVAHEGESKLMVHVVNSKFRVKQDILADTLGELSKYKAATKLEIVDFLRNHNANHFHVMQTLLGIRKFELMDINITNFLIYVSHNAKKLDNGKGIIGGISSTFKNIIISVILSGSLFFVISKIVKKIKEMYKKKNQEIEFDEVLETYFYFGLSFVLAGTLSLYLPKGPVSRVREYRDRLPLERLNRDNDDKMTHLNNFLQAEKKEITQKYEDLTASLMPHLIKVRQLHYNLDMYSKRKEELQTMVQDAGKAKDFGIRRLNVYNKARDVKGIEVLGVQPLAPAVDFGVRAFNDPKSLLNDFNHALKPENMLKSVGVGLGNLSYNLLDALDGYK